MAILRWIKWVWKERKASTTKQQNNSPENIICEGMEQKTCERWVVTLKEEKGYTGNCKDLRWIAEGLGWNDDEKRTA